MEDVGTGDQDCPIESSESPHKLMRFTDDDKLLVIGRCPP